MYKKISTILSLITLSFILASCTYKGEIDIASYGKINNNQKTITVATGNSGLNGALKKELNKKGWSFKVYEGAEKIQGDINLQGSKDNINITRYSSALTRYTLDLSYYKASERIFWNMDIEPIYSYEVSINDNHTGEEIISISGEDSETRAVQRIINAIENNTN